MTHLRARSAESRHVRRERQADATLALRRQARAAGLLVISLRDIPDMATARVCAEEADRQMAEMRDRGRG